MGYLLSSHVFLTKPNLERLAGLPASIGYRIYHHRSADVYLLDTFRGARKPEYPFQQPLPVVDVSLDLPVELGVLDEVYRFLEKRKRGNSFKKSYVNFALFLHRLCDIPVLSFVSDDDELDFACSAAQGALERLRCRSEDLLFAYQTGQLQIQPLIVEDEGEEEFLTNLDELRRSLPSATIAARDQPLNTELHAVAGEEWARFSGGRAPILGLGSFDPPDDEQDWLLLAESG